LEDFFVFKVSEKILGIYRVCRYSLPILWMVTISMVEYI
jgi:hypothetical protein